MANSISKIPVPLIYKKILKDNMSGELTITTDTFLKKLYFVNGRLEFASTTVEHERLGNILLATNQISEDQFHKLKKIKANTNRRTGELVVQLTHLNMRDVYKSIIFQVRQIGANTIPLNEGEWTFNAAIPRIPNNQKLKLKLPEILSEGVKKIKDFSYYKKRFYYRAPVTAPIPEEMGQYLSPAEIKFYANLIKFPNSSVEKIFANSDLPDGIFWRDLTLLYLLNVVDFIEYTVDKELNRNIEEINDLYTRINSDHPDYYELFNINDTAEPKEIKDAYLNYSRKYHPDRLNVAHDSTVALKANAVLAEINKAFETLNDEKKKRMYDLRGHKTSSPDNVSNEHRIKNARALYLKANHLFKQKNFWEAASLLEQAIRIDSSKPSYFLLLGLCQSKSPGTLKAAEDNLKKAAEMEPWNADPVFALGQLYRTENLNRKAEEYYRKALQINMEHTLAGKAMSDLVGPKFKKTSWSLFTKK